MGVGDIERRVPGKGGGETERKTEMTRGSIAKIAGYKENKQLWREAPELILSLG